MAIYDSAPVLCSPLDVVSLEAQHGRVRNVGLPLTDWVSYDIPAVVVQRLSVHRVDRTSLIADRLVHCSMLKRA